MFLSVLRLVESSTAVRRRLCHWGYVDGQRRHGQRARMRVWICEHPYRTVRFGPDPECEGCRWALTIAQAAAAAEESPTPPAA